MKSFTTEFNTLKFVLGNSQRVLLFAHSGPDADTAGSVLALQEYLRGIGKTADIACFDGFPEYLRNLSAEKFLHPENLNLQEYDSIIACDSVERGFEKISDQFSEQQVIILLDHHPDISLEGDINIIDATYSSVCEIIYDYLIFASAKINQNMATFLMLGIMGDTGSFQHSNTTAKIMSVASDLIKKGAALAKITSAMFSNRKIATLKLWGRAFEKARINHDSGMIATVLTQKDIEECGSTSEDIAQVASILNTVPGTKFALILSEREDGKIKGSLRSEEYKGTDVSQIAHRFGGGGHKLASGFEIKGKIIETQDGWEIV